MPTQACLPALLAFLAEQAEQAGAGTLQFALPVSIVLQNPLITTLPSPPASRTNAFSGCAATR